MMNKLTVLSTSLLAAVLVFIAQTNVHSLKWFILYEPAIPESMR